MRKRPLPKFPERARKGPGKKDTKRWCKGIVGREHKFEWVLWPTSGWLKSRPNPWEVEQCQVCGRHQSNLRKRS